MSVIIQSVCRKRARHRSDGPSVGLPEFFQPSLTTRQRAAQYAPGETTPHAVGFLHRIRHHTLRRQPTYHHAGYGCWRSHQYIYSQPPNFSAILTQTSRCYVSPAAQIQRSIIVPPLLCNNGRSVVLNRPFQLRRREAKYCDIVGIGRQTAGSGESAPARPIRRSDTAK